jgi:hypothetical protein
LIIRFDNEWINFFVWLFGRLIGWLVDSLIGRLVDWFVGGLINSFCLVY